jgi:hypothetical protein
MNPVEEEGYRGRGSLERAPGRWGEEEVGELKGAVEARATFRNHIEDYQQTPERTLT